MSRSGRHRSVARRESSNHFFIHVTPISGRPQNQESEMCEQCLSRRSLIAVAALGAAAAVLRPVALMAADDQTDVSADEALAGLKQGNARFIEAPKLCALDLANARESVIKAQAPWATILSCSDSRVPPELLFGGIGVGEL